MHRDIKRLPGNSAREQVSNLLKLASGLLDDAEKSTNLRPETRTIIIYSASLNLARALLAHSRFTIPNVNHHIAIWELAAEILGPHSSLQYLSDKRRVRNIATYWSSNCVSKEEADETLQQTINFDTVVRNWLRQHCR